MENNKPKTFTLNCDSWAGALTKKSVKVAQPKCPKCNRDIEEEIAYSKIQLLAASIDTPPTTLTNRQ